MSGEKKPSAGAIHWVVLVVLLICAIYTLAFRRKYIMEHPTERYLVAGEKNGEKVERVVDLHRAYRTQSATAPIIKETDGYGNVYHHVYYTEAADDDTIYGFDTIQSIRKL